jgi:hypothetical protein
VFPPQPLRAFTAKKEIRLREALDRREEKMRKKRAPANDWRKARGYEARPSLEGGFVDALKPAVLVSVKAGRGYSFLMHYAG